MKKIDKHFDEKLKEFKYKMIQEQIDNYFHDVHEKDHNNVNSSNLIVEKNLLLNNNNNNNCVYHKESTPYKNNNNLHNQVNTPRDEGYKHNNNYYNNIINENMYFKQKR